MSDPYLLHPTKQRVLTQLRDKPMTAAEVARCIGVHRSATHRHLKALEDMGFVERTTPMTRKWVYFALTPRGTTLLDVLEEARSEETTDDELSPQPAALPS